MNEPPPLRAKHHRRRPAMAETVLTQMRQAILDGLIPPGSRIRQEELADRFGVSRIPIREALLTLEREGLLQTRGGRGMVVAPLDPALINDIYEVRQAMDGYVSASLAGRGGFDRARFQPILADGRAACERDDFKALIKLDFLFHLNVYEALGNRVIVDVMRAQWTHIKRAIALTLTAATFAKYKFWEAHEAILESIVSGDVDRAREAAVEHIQFARTVLLGELSSATLLRQRHKAGAGRSSVH
jgi:DNA-binding GntR family transcriptional regulator